MPVYNAERTLKPAIWSVLNQGFSQFELVIYNDGSNDNSEHLIHSFSDSRIRYISVSDNRGIVNARNELIVASRGKYIAWLDADDIMLPGRLAAQYDFLEQHPDVFLVGSWVEVRNDKKVKKVRWPASENMVKSWLFFRNPLVQSSLMMRNDKGILKYRTEMEYLEDYAFYTSIYLKQKMAILPQYLVSYYQDNQTSMIHKYRKYNFVEKLETIMQGNFAQLNLAPGKNELALIREFLRSNHRIKPEDAKRLRNFLLLVRKQNRIEKIFPVTEFELVVQYQLIRLLRNAGLFQSGALSVILFSPLKCIRALFAGPRYH